MTKFKIKTKMLESKFCETAMPFPSLSALPGLPFTSYA